MAKNVQIAPTLRPAKRLATVLITQITATPEKSLNLRRNNLHNEYIIYILESTKENK